jgi:hypothetical protein
MEKIEIGLSCSPSKIINVESFDGIRVVISRNTMNTLVIYCKPQIIKEQAINGLWEFKTIDGVIRKFNYNHIIEITDVKIVKVVSDVTEHINYNKVSCEHKEIEEYFVIEQNEECIINWNKYIPRHMDVLRDKLILTNSKTI